MHADRAQAGEGDHGDDGLKRAGDARECAPATAGSPKKRARRAGGSVSQLEFPFNRRVWVRRVVDDAGPPGDMNTVHVNRRTGDSLGLMESSR
jgi:hypothetical protein